MGIFKRFIKSWIEEANPFSEINLPSDFENLPLCNIHWLTWRQWEKLGDGKLRYEPLTGETFKITSEFGSTWKQLGERFDVLEQPNMRPQWGVYFLLLDKLPTRPPKRNYFNRFCFPIWEYFYPDKKCPTCGTENLEYVGQNCNENLISLIKHLN